MFTAPFRSGEILKVEKRSCQGGRDFTGRMGGGQEYGEYGSLCDLEVERLLGIVVRILLIPELER